MPTNPSRHLLPVNSMMFTSRAALPRSSSLQYQHPTLVNLHEAGDASVTALPPPPPPPPSRTTTTTAAAKTDKKEKKKKTMWARVGAKIQMLFRGKKEKKEQKPSMVISGPSGFRHETTWGPSRLRSGGVGGAKWDEGEGVGGERGDSGEWEDVEQSRVFVRG